jgi:Xaa-Pro aminopeptidase
VGNYNVDGKPRPLLPGMVFTVEPGLYFSAENDRIPAALRGIGVRIEDDIVTTDDGFEILTEAIPKQIGEVEAWMRE